MRNLALNALRKEPLRLDTKTYFANEYVYAKDVALALHLACKAQNLQQRIYNAGTGIISTPADIAQALGELVPRLDVRVVGETEKDGRELPLDLSRSQAELGYSPQFPLRRALQDYMEELKTEG